MRKWLVGVAALVLLASAVMLIWASVRLKPKLRERIVAALKEQYHRDVELKAINISLFPRFSAVGEGLVIQQKEKPGLPPMIVVNRLTVQATLRGMLSEPLRVEHLTLDGLQLNIPPKQHDTDKPEEEKREQPHFIINEVVADGTVLQILPKKADKEPLVF